MGSEWILALLLLPVAAYSGWFIATKKELDSTDPASRNIPPEYLKGLNYVLNEEQDKAIELFIKMLEVDSDTVETHLALGNLFRRRGEVDRAIRIHQNLIARPIMSNEYKSLVLLELGMDYMRSGLFDRAENLFKELLDSSTHSVQAFTQLLDIYQQEKDWSQAIVIARSLEEVSGEKLAPVIAQFYCELAEEYLTTTRLEESSQYIKLALNSDPSCVRASLIEARLHRKLGKHKNAIKAYKRIEKQDAEYLPESIGPMLECYRDIGKLDEYVVYLKKVVSKYGGITPLLYLTQLINELDGEDKAIKYISAELRKRPSVRGVDCLLEFTLKKADGEIRDSLETIKEMTGRLFQSKAIYKCSHCGFDAKLLHWLCPGCKYWCVIKPVHGVEGE